MERGEENGGCGKREERRKEREEREDSCTQHLAERERERERSVNQETKALTLTKAMVKKKFQ